MGGGLHERLQASLGAADAIERERGGGGMSRVFVAEEARREMQASEARSIPLLCLRGTPEYAAIRRDPRFQALVQKIGFP
jgi:hypothetical protein